MEAHLANAVAGHWVSFAAITRRGGLRQAFLFETPRFWAELRDCLESDFIFTDIFRGITAEDIGIEMGFVWRKLDGPKLFIVSESILFSISRGD